jgi:hypothetical protein
MIDKTIDKETVEKIAEKIKYMVFNKQLSPVSAVFADKTKLFMERINGTTLYLSNMRKILYDLSFADIYNFDGRIPKAHIVIDTTLYKIDDWCHIENCEKFLSLLDRDISTSHGTCIYLDDVLHASNISFLTLSEIRNDLLHSRNSGDMHFKCLKVVDASGHVTLFEPRNNRKHAKSPHQN